MGIFDKEKNTEGKNRTPLITFVAMIAVIAFLFASYMLMAYLAEDTISAVSISEEDKAKLNSLYDAGDYEGLIKLINSDDKYARIWDYEHYASEKDIEILDGIKNDVMCDILFNRMGYTEGDMESARGDIMKNNYFHTDRADKFSDTYYERYR